MKVQKHADRPEGRRLRAPTIISVLQLFHSINLIPIEEPEVSKMGVSSCISFICRSDDDRICPESEPVRTAITLYSTHFVVRPAAPLSGLLLVVGVVGAVSSALLLIHPD